MAVRSIFFIAIIINGVFGTLEDEWSKFKQEHNKSYRNSEEEQKRFDIFKTNLIEINEHNENYKKGLVTYVKGMNKYGDLTADGFLDLYKLYFLMPKLYNDPLRPNANAININEKNGEETEFLDWSKKGAVTPAKDQGTCGACWIFSAVGVVEGYYFRTHKKLLSLSEQNLVDCISNQTCSGGYVPIALHYIQRFGINSEADYPYEGKHVECRYDVSKNVNVTFNEIVRIDPNEDKLKLAVTNFGPVMVALCATSNWRFYKSGVWYEKECCERVNHALLLVGYGRENGQDYWLVKNSMGPNWGENGFIKIARNKHQNYCGITNFVFYII